MTEPTGRCPVDDAPAPRSARYPRALCMDCVELATDLDGRPVAMMNISSNGGFQAVHFEGGMQVSGTLYVPPKPYAATVAEMRDDSHGAG